MFNALIFMFLILVFLKLGGAISWPWWGILAPIWGPALGMVMFSVAFFVALVVLGLAVALRAFFTNGAK